MGRKKIKLDLNWIQHLVSLGLNQKQICLAIGVSEDTLQRRKDDDPKLEQVLKHGGVNTIVAVANALVKAALDGDVRAQIFFLRSQAHWHINRLDRMPMDMEEEEPEVSRERILARIHEIVREQGWEDCFLNDEVSDEDSDDDSAEE